MECVLSTFLFAIRYITPINAPIRKSHTSPEEYASSNKTYHCHKFNIPPPIPKNDNIKNITPLSESLNRTPYRYVIKTT